MAPGLSGQSSAVPRHALQLGAFMAVGLVLGALIAGIGSDSKFMSYLPGQLAGQNHTMRVISTEVQQIVDQVNSLVAQEEKIKAMADNVQQLITHKDAITRDVQAMATEVKQIATKQAEQGTQVVEAVKAAVATPAPAAAAQAAPAEPCPPPNAALRLNNEVAVRKVNFGGADLMVMALPNDEYVGASILANGQPFEPQTLGWMMDQIKPGTTVVDAGCNFGSYSIFFAARTGANGHVHCFEPQQKMMQLAMANAVLNGFSHRMTVHHNALSFAPGVVEMSAKLPDGQMGGQAMADVENKKGTINYGGLNLGKGGEKTTALTLDSFNLTNVSFIKVDVQGAERLMLWGARNTITRDKPVVIYEHQAGFDVTQDMIDAMKVPQEVLSWSVDEFFAGLGYTKEPHAGDIMQRPPAASTAGRRLMRRLRRMGAGW